MNTHSNSQDRDNNKDSHGEDEEKIGSAHSSRKSEEGGNEKDRS